MENTAHGNSHLELQTTQARTCGIKPTQEPESLRERTTGGGETTNKHEQPTNTNTKEEQQQQRRQTERPTQEAPPPPKVSGALCGVADHDTNEKQNHRPTGEGEGGPSTRSDKLYHAS